MANDFELVVYYWLNKVYLSRHIDFSSIQSEYEPSIKDLKYLETSLINSSSSHDKGLSLDLTKIILKKATGSYLKKILKQRKIQSLKISIKNKYDLKVLKELSGLNLFKLDLSYSVIPEMKELIDIIKVSNIKQLCLDNCSIGDNDFVLIINQLKDNLLELELSENQISDECTETIIELLADKKKFIIHFQGYKIGVDYKLFHVEQFSMALNDNILTDEGRFNIIKSLANRQKVQLHLRMYDTFAPFMSYGLKKKSGIRNIPQIEIDDVESLEICHLIEKVQFHGLIMDYSGLTDDVLETFIKDLKYSEINEFSLSHCEISNEDIDKLFKILPETQIDTLNISKNLFDHIGTQTIVKNINNTDIKCLRLGFNDIGRAGILSIINFIPTSKLIELDLSSLGIDDELLILLCKAIKSSEITKLNLSGNDITTAGIKKLAQVLPKTKLVSLNLCNALLDDKCLLSIINNGVKGKFCEIYLDYCQISTEMEEIIMNILESYYLLTSDLDIGESTKKRLHDLINRNRTMVQGAANLIKKFQDGTLVFNSKVEDDLLNFQLVADHYYLWSDIKNADVIKSEMLNQINDYFQKTGIVENTVHRLMLMVKSILNMPLRLIRNIYYNVILKNVAIPVQNSHQKYY